MIFGDMAPDDAEGAILAHSQKAGAETFKKGRVLSRADIAALREAGVSRIVAARLEETDVPEDEAAEALQAPSRASLSAPPRPSQAAPISSPRKRGVLEIDAERIQAINMIGEALTVATLALFETVSTRQDARHRESDPFRRSRADLDKALEIARLGPLPFRSAVSSPRRVGLVADATAAAKKTVLDKSRAVLDARLDAMGSRIAREIRVPHDVRAVADAS